MDTFTKHGVEWPRKMQSCCFPDLPLGLGVMVVPVARIRPSNDEIQGKVTEPDENLYTVIGVHEHGHENRYAESFLAESPEDAEATALAEHPALLIAGVVEGSARLVDTDPGTV